MRLRSLDTVRGVAALAVVAYHFQHLAAFGQDPFSWTIEPSALPFFAVLKPVYLYGWMAVDLFFTISGFVFFWIYREAINDRRIGFTTFLVLRLTRLYPLHLLTLLLVALLQSLYKFEIGAFFVVPYNDGHHFWLNALFMQGWGIERGPSFNGPSWSVSVEMLLYLVFFAFARQRLSLSASALAGMVCLGLIIQTVSPILGRGVAGFFAGGLALYALDVVGRNPHARTLARATAWVAALLWIIVIAAAYLDLVDRALDAIGQGHRAGIANKAAGRFVLYAVFPISVFALAASERLLGHDWSRTSPLGDISYASYLIHFPLQLIFALVVAYGVLSTDRITGAGAFLAFFALLIPLSWATYRYFELPMQRWGRRALLGRRPRVASS